MVSVGVDVAVSSISSRIFSLGFKWSGVLRDLSSGSMATASRCSAVYPDGSVRLGEVRVAAHQVRVFRASRRLHVPQLPVLGPVELVHHVSIPSESRVLRRSLEPVPYALLLRAALCADPRENPASPS